MRWYLAHDRGPLPHLFRVLYLFWSQRDLGREAWSWVEQLLPAFGPLGGDPERAALLEGAADGLRRRVGLRAWPVLRRAEAELVGQVRQRLGATRFDQVFSAGSGLAQQRAVAIVRDQRGTGTQVP